MPHGSKGRPLSGRLEELLFSPKGGIEGLLVLVGSKPVQVSVDPETADAGTLAAAIGEQVHFMARADHSQKTEGSAHPVYKADRVIKISGKAVKSGGRRPAVTGVVSRIHYAKHGEPNGVVLKTGEFIHTRPPGMRKLKLKVGSRVVATGEMRMTVLGTPLIEAEKVNRIKID